VAQNLLFSWDGCDLAARKLPDLRHLPYAWSPHLRAPPAWLCDIAAVANLPRQSLAIKRAALGRQMRRAKVE
jgi:hypothetical protein